MLYIRSHGSEKRPQYHKYETQTEISICIIYPEWDDPRIESHDKNLSIYFGFIFLCISACDKMIFLLLTISPFLVSSSSLHGRNIGECTDNQVG